MKKILTLFALTLMTLTGNAQFHTLGDVNTDGEVNVTDVTELVNIILKGQSPFRLELSMNVGEYSTMNISSGSGSYTVQSSNANVLSAELNSSKIIVTAVGVGTATITVKDSNSDHRAIITVTVNSSFSNSLCPDENHPHVIDLGLPSGTKWACCNVGTSTPYEYGGHCAWGETYMKDHFGWNNYTLCNGTYESCRDIGMDISGTQYDIAKVKWGNEWRLPTNDQFKELSKNTTRTWTTVNGVNGCIFTWSTGRSIFLPVAGWGFKNEIYNIGSSGYYMSSTRHPSYQSNNYRFYFYSGGSSASIHDARFHGLSVRPVSVNKQFSDLVLSIYNVELTSAESSSIQIISGSGEYTVQSNDENVAKAEVSGNTIIITALGNGTATITVTDSRSNQTATITVTVDLHIYLTCPDENHPHMIDLGLPSGTIWACCNVGGSKPSDYGGYYAWGETEEKDVYTWSTYIHCDGSYDTCHDIGSDIAGTQYDVATVKWGEIWQMPTQDQYVELAEQCTEVDATINNVVGLKYIGPNGGSIFMPLAGCRTDIIDEVGWDGFYWQSEERKTYTSYNSHSAPIFILGIGGGSNATLNNFNKFCGLSVRPIVKKQNDYE